jgi:hypothetical protein
VSLRDRDPSAFFARLDRSVTGPAAPAADELGPVEQAALFVGPGEDILPPGQLDPLGAIDGPRFAGAPAEFREVELSDPALFPRAQDRDGVHWWRQLQRRWRLQLWRWWRLQLRRWFQLWRNYQQLGRRHNQLQRRHRQLRRHDKQLGWRRSADRSASASSPPAAFGRDPRAGHMGADDYGLPWNRRADAPPQRKGAAEGDRLIPKYPPRSARQRPGQ